MNKQSLISRRLEIKPLVVIVDSDAIVAQSNLTDANHDLAIKISTKKNTTFDAAVAAVADKYKADYIFGFDAFYEKKGFKLAKALLEKETLESEEFESIVGKKKS